MNIAKSRLIIVSCLIIITLSGCVNKHIARTVTFERPDIKNDFCGVHINFQYCKCAFHNQFCKEIGLSKKAANDKVQADFRAWWQPQLDAFLAQCRVDGGIATDDQCSYCDAGYVADEANGRCVEADEAEVTTTYETPTGEEVITADCQIVSEIYDRDWKKYSDIDEVIPFEERSYEAKQTLIVYETMVSKMVEAFALERDIEIENQMQAELENYRQALVQNIKTNLLKSFWRLSWVTYTTIKSGSGLGSSYEQLLTSAEGIEAVGTGLKVVQGIIPSESSLAIDTSTVTGKAKSVGASAALEAVESLGDPVKVATSVFENASNASLPSADITPEEIEILKNQHLSKGVVDEVLAESRAANAQRSARLETLEQEIIQLQTEVNSWEQKEKDRVRVEIEESCKKK